MPYFALTAPPGPARPPARKYWPSEDEVVHHRPDSRHGVFVVSIDDGGTPGDIVVVADVPLRDVDQVVIAQAM